MSAIAPDGVSFENWIGSSHVREDALTPRIAAEFEETFGPNLLNVSGAPLVLFWTLAPDIEPAVSLGQDAYPKLGLYLPPLPFPSHMWGEMKFKGHGAPGAFLEGIRR